MYGVGATALSHTGRVRANNQDSGYAGKHLFVVADGMGGHAGGDIASALTIESIRRLDQPFPDVDSARVEFVNSLLETNARLRAVVQDFPEITGMGTTVTGMLVVGNQGVIAHIGDSRLYRFRDGVLTQISKDHTFVQRLVDAGRITPEEALVHPRRSVIMRVLGDVEAHPEIDSSVVDIEPGDRWLFCSDGLSGPVPEDEIADILGSTEDRNQATATLIQAALDHGAPDNVTAIVLEPGTEPLEQPEIVGSVANHGTLDHLRSHFDSTETTAIQSLGTEPANDGGVSTPASLYLASLIADHRRRKIRRRIIASVISGLAIAALVVGGILGYNWTQSRYFIGAGSDGVVTVYRGVNGSIGKFKLSTKITDSSLPTIRVDSLPTDLQSSVRNTVSVDSYAAAKSRMSELRKVATQSPETSDDDTGTSDSSASPSASAAASGAN